MSQLIDWFVSWIGSYIATTGADTNTATLLMSNRNVIVDHWRATLAELQECTTRLVVGMRVPKFPNEHTDAIGRELIRLRAERKARAQAAPPADCRLCNGVGWVVVPHPSCVAHGQLATYHSTRGVYTVAVICTECTTGRTALEAEGRRVAAASEAGLGRRPHRLTLDRYTALVHGADGAALLREHEHARKSKDDAFVEGFPQLLAMIGK